MIQRRRRPNVSASTRALLILLTTAAMLLLSGNGAGAQQETPTPPADPGHHHHHGDARTPTAEQQAAADELVGATQAAMSRFADSAAAEAAGYRMVTPFAFYGARAAHYLNAAYAYDGRQLDPERPETLVYLKQDDGSLVLLGVMFVAPIGEGAAIGGPLTMWHTHDDLCAHPAGPVPSSPTGECPTGTWPLGFEMLHVWLVDHPDGPFADAPPPATVKVVGGEWPIGGSLAAGSSLIDTAALSTAVAEVLGLQPAEIEARFAQGASLAEIAVAQEVPREAVVHAVGLRLTLDYDRAVVVGDMTPAQRDLLVSTLPMMVERMVDLHAGEPWLLTPTEHAH